MLGEGYRLKVSAKRVARRIFGPKRRKWQEAAEDCTVRSIITCMLHHVLLGW